MGFTLASGFIQTQPTGAGAPRQLRRSKQPHGQYGQAKQPRYWRIVGFVRIANANAQEGYGSMTARNKKITAGFVWSCCPGLLFGQCRVVVFPRKAGVWQKNWRRQRVPQASPMPLSHSSASSRMEMGWASSSFDLRLVG